MSLGIIGGADGPTAVLVSSAMPLWGYIAGALLAVVAVTTVILLFKNKK